MRFRMDETAAAALERGSGVALWRQIGARLSEEIGRAAYPPGARLPTEGELARRFGVNRHTVRRAIATLAERGLLRVEQGRGTFVADVVLDYPLGRRTRFSENVLRQSREPGGRLLRAEVVPAAPEAARELDLRPGAGVTLIESLGLADGVPVSLGSNHFPHDRFPDLIAAYREAGGSITRALRRCGVEDYTRRVSRVLARMPTAAEAEALRQPRTQPVLVTESVDVDAAGRPVRYGITRFAGERVQLVVEP
jgi:GntR family phosphonate transport system transcriptional regulator